MITIKNLSFSYRKDEMILRNINYIFEDGKTYLILGKNGSGKTTLIRIVLGFLKPTHGNIFMNTSKVISYLPDFNGIYDDLSIIDNIKFRLSLYNIKFEDKIALFNELLNKYNLQDKENCKVKELSLGMKKKVAIIASLLIDADVYILDEPTGGIDKESREEIINLLNDYNKENKIIICITHESDLINCLNANIVRLENGILIDELEKE